MLTLAATLENQSEHPLALPVLDELNRRGLGMISGELKEFHHHTGLGIHARIQGVWVGVGREKMFDEHGVEVPRVVLEHAEQARAAGQTALIVLATEEKIAGVIAVADTLRPEARSALEKLKKLGIGKLVLLTGDHERVAKAICRSLPIDDIRAGLLPESKVTELKRLATAERLIAMVGDGVNDAPALAAADVGIAMGGGGTDVALEVADVVLMRDNLRSLPTAVWISRLARKRVRQNMIFAFGMIGVLAMSTFFSLPLWLGVIGHEGSTLLVVLNGIRMLWESVPDQKVDS
jgi:Cd2+/Zn2+-exporting ATPase